MNIYEKAIEILRERGWTQGYLNDTSDKRTCINGALIRAAGLRITYATYDDPRYVALVLPLVQALNLDTKYPATSLQEWNDEDKTTEDDVFAALETCLEREAVTA